MRLLALLGPMTDRNDRFPYPFIYLPFHISEAYKTYFFRAEPQCTKTSTTPKRFSTGGSFFRKMLVEESARLENKHDMHSNTAKI